MSVSKDVFLVKMSREADEDMDARLHFFRRFVGAYVTVSTPQRTARGTLKAVDWDPEREEYGFVLEDDDGTKEFVSLHTEGAEVVYE